MVVASLVVGVDFGVVGAVAVGGVCGQLLVGYVCVGPLLLFQPAMAIGLYFLVRCSWPAVGCRWQHSILQCHSKRVPACACLKCVRINSMLELWYFLCVGVRFVLLLFMGRFFIACQLNGHGNPEICNPSSRLIAVVYLRTWTSRIQICSSHSIVVI